MGEVGVEGVDMAPKMLLNVDSAAAAAILDADEPLRGRASGTAGVDEGADVVGAETLARENQDGNRFRGASSTTAGRLALDLEVVVLLSPVKAMSKNWGRKSPAGGL